MAKSFDDLVAKTMTKEEIERSDARAREMIDEVMMQQVRELAGVTQAELARRLGIKQPSLSKMESQSQDMRVGTLRRIVAALGGKLDLVVKLPNKGTVHLVDFHGRDGSHLIVRTKHSASSHRSAAKGKTVRFVYTKRSTTKARAGRKASAIVS